MIFVDTASLLKILFYSKIENETLTKTAEFVIKEKNICLCFCYY